MDAVTARARLHEQLKGLLSRADKVQAHLRQADRELPQDWEDRASLLENDEVLDALDASTRGEIAQIRAALARLDAGSYGRCEGCEGRIPEGRLQVLPTATRCVRCAS